MPGAAQPVHALLRVRRMVLLSLCPGIGTTTPRLHELRENHRTGKTHRIGAWGEGEERRTHGETRTGKTIAAEKHTAEAHWVGKQPFHTTLFGVCTPDIGRGASACRERATRTTKNRGVIDCIMLEICVDHD